MNDVAIETAKDLRVLDGSGWSCWRAIRRTLGSIITTAIGYRSSTAPHPEGRGEESTYPRELLS